MTKEVSERQLPAPKLPFSTSSLDLVIVKRRPAMSGNGSEGNGMGLRIFALALAAAAPSTAFAAPIAPSCPAAPVPPPELAGWSRDAAGKTFYAFGDDLGADWAPLGAERTELPLHTYESLRHGVGHERKPHA